MKYLSRLQRIPYYGFWALLAYMPFHIFLSQSLSATTGGLDIWKIAKDVILAVLVVFTICLVWRTGRGSKPFWTVLAASVAYLGFHLVVWAAHTGIDRESAILGMVYNLRLPAFLVLGMGAALLNPGKFVFSTLIKVVLTVSSLVAALGILQYFLPTDTLSHFGYSLERGARPAFFIDDDPHLPRIMSTLREPNALGAYLLLPIAALLSLLFRFKDTGRRYLLGGLLGLHLLALFLTHSRSAWLAALVVIGLVAGWQYRQLAVSLLRRWWPVAAALVVAVAIAGWQLKDSQFFQEYVIHSNPQETVQDLDSNDYHWLLVRQGLEGIADQPFGHGPGTAGIVSIRAQGGGQLTENYYVQLGYEIGIAGALLFIAGTIWVYVRLMGRKDSLGVLLCAAFWGYVVTNMLLHSWSNEAVAAQWWLLAGVALVVPVVSKKPSGKT